MAPTHDARHLIDDDGRDDGQPALVPLEDLVDKAVTRALGWLAESERVTGRTGSGGSGDSGNSAGDPAAEAPVKDSSDHAAEQLAKLVHDPAGVDYTMAFVDQVARPEDNGTAANQLAAMTKGTKAPAFLSAMDRAAMQLGGIMAPKFPWLVMPIARKRMRQLVGHLVLDADGKALNELLTDARARDRQLNLNLLGEAVLGSKEAQRRLHDTMALLRDPLVDYVSVKASSVVSQLNPWDFDGSVERLVQTLRPLYRIAADAPGRAQRANPPFINLDMEEYHDLDLTLEVFERILSEDEFLGLEAGIVLQAYLPDSVAALDRLIDFAKKRVARGGAPVKVRLVKGANLSMETVTADLHGWVRAPYSSKAETDANYLRLLDRALRPDVADALRVGVASHNLFSMAAAVELARARGVEKQIDAEMLQGMAPMQQKVIQEDVGRLILYTPVVDADSFDVAVSYLVRRLEENAAEENFLHAMTSVDESERAGDTSLLGKAEPVDIAHALREVGNRLAPAAEAAGVRLTCSGDPVIVRGIPSLLDELAYNLCDNAIRYNHAGGTVDARIDVVDGCPRLVVADTGLGIPEAAQAKVFERFYRVDASRSRERGGTGLGLAIVKHAAAYHGANLALESKEGVGTTVTVTFPESSLVEALG